MSIDVVYSKGLKQMAIAIYDGTNYGANMFTEAPAGLDREEDATDFQFPGADVIKVRGKTIKGLKLKLKFNALDLVILAKLMGSQYSQIGTSPNQKTLIDRRTTDSPPYFRLTGVVKYIGPNFPNGDYRCTAYYCQLVSPPKINHETEKEAAVELEVYAYERPDGLFYTWEANETSAALSAVADTVAPTFGSPSPAAAATAVVVTANVLVTASKEIQFVPNQFKLYASVSSVLTLVPTENTYDRATGVVTIDPAASLAAATLHTLKVEGVNDLEGNPIAAPYTTSFTTA